MDHVAGIKHHHSSLIPSCTHPMREARGTTLPLPLPDAGSPSLGHPLSRMIGLARLLFSTTQTAAREQIQDRHRPPAACPPRGRHAAASRPHPHAGVSRPRSISQAAGRRRSRQVMPTGPAASLPAPWLGAWSPGSCHTGRWCHAWQRTLKGEDSRRRRIPYWLSIFMYYVSICKLSCEARRPVSNKHISAEPCTGLVTRLVIPVKLR